MLKDLKAFCRWLVAEEFLDKGPKVPLPKLPSTLCPVLTDDELLRVFATNQHSPRTEIGCRNRALVAFMLDTGVRLSEVCRLQLADVQIRDGMAGLSHVPDTACVRLAGMRDQPICSASPPLRGVPHVVSLARELPGLRRPARPPG